MRHRHIVDGYEDTVEAVEDILARGSVEDWRALAAVVRSDPRGPAAQSLRVVVDHVPMYGTTHLWRWFLDDIDAQPIKGGPKPCGVSGGG